MSLINKEVSDFTAKAYHDNGFITVTKEDLLGKWSVFFFYPADFTFVCPTELADLESFYEEFKKNRLRNLFCFLRYGICTQSLARSLAAHQGYYISHVGRSDPCPGP